MVKVSEYGLRCTLLWEDYQINITLPALWDSIENAINAKLSFFLSEEGLICKESEEIIAIILSNEWWNYRIAKLKDYYRNLKMIDISHYEPKEWTLKDFLPYRDNRNNVALEPYSLSYASYQVYIK